MSAPVLVKVVDHRERDQKERKLGHHAYVQERTPASIRRYGGRRYAVWARRTVDGQETGTPERFETYDSDGEAMAHALYAAGRVTPTALELLANGRRLP